MALHLSFLFLLKLLAENVFVLRVSLGEVVVSKALAKFELGAALGVAFDKQLDAPLDFRGRALPAAAKELVILQDDVAGRAGVC